MSTVPAASARERIEMSIARYAAREPQLRAFVWFDADRARALADRATDGALAGLPVGIKDVVDTAGIPTRYGSRLFEGRVPDRDALVVQRLRAAGAIDIGKTVTTEFAFYEPGPTTNPYDARRTPGGSSMGSAAAVAADIVPLAIGTQTNGSIIRPAAFCGVVGYKPSVGRVARDGVMEFSSTLDTIGGFARSVADAARLVAVMAADAVHDASPVSVSSASRIAAVGTRDWDRATVAMQRSFMADVDALAWAGAIVEHPVLPEEIDATGVELLRTIMCYEGARSIGTKARAFPGLVSARSLAFFEEGARISDSRYAGALEMRARLMEVFRRWAIRYDAIITPPTTGEAPARDTTGDPRFCSRWTLLGVPAITIPTRLGPSGLPLGLQLVAGPQEDARLIRTAAWAESVFAVAH